MTNLDRFYDGIVTQDNKTRMQTYSELIEYLQTPDTSCKADDLGSLVDGLAAWVSSSNFKVSLCGLEVLCLLVNRVGESFRPYIVNVLECTVNRLGDMHDDVREVAQDLLLRLMNPASTPSFVFDRIWPTASVHKQFRVRENICICLQNVLNHFGAKSVTLNKIVPQVRKMLDDSNAQVREAALNALCEIYRHVGERVRQDLLKQGLSQSKLSAVLARFDEVRSMGDMLPTVQRQPASSSNARLAGNESDSARLPVFKTPAQPKPPSAARKTSHQMPPSKAALQRSALTSSMRRSRSASLPPTNMPLLGAGALSEDMFTNSFDQVPKVNIFSGRDVDDKLQTAFHVLSGNADWEKKVHEYKLIRSLVIEGGANYDEFYAFLRQLETAFVLGVKDLRSQVVREACITIAFLAQNLESRLDHFCETIVPSLINLVANSAKVMATSGITALRFIVQSVHSHRLIPIIISYSTSKSNPLRKFSFQLIEQLLGLWSTHTLERYVGQLQEAIKKGVGDADADARTFARKAFWLFNQHFKRDADHLYDQLDGTRQKQLQGQLSQSSSSNSVNSQSDRPPAKTSNRVGAANRSRSNDRAQNDSAFSAGTLPSPRDGARRSVRGVGSNRSNLSARPRKTSAAASTSEGVLSNGAPKSRVSQSQPRGSASLDSGVEHTENTDNAGSRSNSPSSRLFGSALSHVTPRRKKSGIPRSQGASRETSPSRYGYTPHNNVTPGRRPLGSSHHHNHQLDGTSNTADLLAQKLSGSSSFSRKRYDSYGVHSDDDAGSETSSLASESMSQFAGSARVTDDANDIIRNLSSGQWSERKEGLLQLQYFVTNIRSLNPTELRRVTEVFTRMFHDPHAKVFSIFMDTLVEVLQIHKHQLQDWLQTLISRLLTKCGGEMLASVAAKAQRTLDAIMETFDNVSQFLALMRFLGDSASTINFKVKLVYLNYLHSLLNQMDMSELINNNDSRSAISKIITWISEPKSADVRKASTAVIVAMFNLNPPEFSSTVANLQKTFQDIAHKVIANHMQGVVDTTDGLKNPLLSASPGGRGASPRHREQHRASPRSRLASSGSAASGDTPSSGLHPARPLNPDEIFQSIRQTTADIQNLSLNSGKLEVNALGKERDSTSQDSGIQRSFPDVRNESPDLSKPAPGYEYKPSRYATPLTETTGQMLNGIGAVSDIDRQSDDMAFESQDPLCQILEELSNHDERVEERQHAMDELIRMAVQGGDAHRWDEHFKTLLLLLLETLGDKEAHIRTQALQVLREIIKTERKRFDQYAELTILKVVEAHNDENKEVVRAAEECASMMARCIKPEHSVIVLGKLTDTVQFPQNVAAIKMQTQVIEMMDTNALQSVLHRVVPGLLKGYQDQESSCRKASVFALVALYVKVGNDSLMPHLSTLNGSKLKLLNLYIKRAETQKPSS